MHHIHRSFAGLALLPLLALLACGGTIAGGASPSPPASPSGQRVQVALTDFQITPAHISVHQGAVVFQVTNRGKTPHNLTLRTPAGSIAGRTPDLAPGRSAALPLDLAAGTYTSFCSLPGHESLGMRETVTVDG